MDPIGNNLDLLFGAIVVIAICFWLMSWIAKPRCRILNNEDGSPIDIYDNVRVYEVKEEYNLPGFFNVYWIKLAVVKSWEANAEPEIITIRYESGTMLEYPSIKTVEYSTYKLVQRAIDRYKFKVQTTKPIKE